MEVEWPSTSSITRSVLEQVKYVVSPVQVVEDKAVQRVD